MFEEELGKLPARAPRACRDLPGLRVSAVPQTAAIVSMAALVLAMLGFVLFAVRTEPRLRLLFGSTRTVNAQALSVTEGGNCGAHAHRIFYGFTADGGGQFKGALTVCDDSPYYASRPGDTIPVRYLIADPSVFVPAAARSDEKLPRALLFAMLLVIVVLVPALSGRQLRELMQARRIYAKGELANAEVVFVKRRSDYASSGRYSGGAEVFVRFRLPTGETREAAAWCGNDWLLHLLTPGVPVHIAYAPQNLKRVALLEAYLR